MGSLLSSPNEGKFVGCGTRVMFWLMNFTKRCSLNLKLGALCILVTSAVVVYQQKRNMSKASINKVVFITGCDSGLGFSFALHAHKLGFTVVAGCLQTEGEGAKQLKKLCPERLHVLKLDVTNITSIQAAIQMTRDILISDPLFELHALINNAGVMIFGEFEWLTESHIVNQLNVNLLGAMQVTRGLCSMIRKYKGRIITISSHCALATLPGLAVYGATKAGLAAWCDGLRVEQAKYGVSVITFIPGSFVQHSNIMSRQREYAREMEEKMDPVNHQFFGDYFRRYNQHLCGISIPRTPVPLHNDKLYSSFEDALLSCHPYTHYEHAPFRYQYYHFLFKISPTWLRDYLVQRFMQMPSW